MLQVNPHIKYKCQLVLKKEDQDYLMLKGTP